MRIFGVDPGTARVGWAVVETKGYQPTAIAYGCITTLPSEPIAQRLSTIFRLLTSQLERYQPDCVSVEELFFATNAKTAIAVGEARGVILLAAAQQSLPVISYTPLAVKRTICGSGQADKTQVQKMVTRMLHLTKIPQPDDAADALAIALTHAYSYKLKTSIA